MLAIRGMPHYFRKQLLLFFLKLGWYQILWWFSFYDLLGSLWRYHQPNMPGRDRLWGILGCVAISLDMDSSEVLLNRAWSSSLRQWNQWVVIWREQEGTKVTTDCWLWQVVKFKCVQFWHRLLLTYMVHLNSFRGNSIRTCSFVGGWRVS
jgi:hypothetical protein